MQDDEQDFVDDNEVNPTDEQDSADEVDNDYVDDEDTGGSAEVDENAGSPALKTFDEAYVQKLRRENAKHRRESKAAIAKAREEAAEEARDEFARDLRGAFGIDDDDEDFDPDEIIAQANERAHEADSRLAQYRIKDTLNTAARKAGADESLLFPYLRGSGALDGLDPADDDFDELIVELVEDAVDANPKLKLDAPAPRRSGGDMSGGNGESKSKSPKTIDDLRARRRKWREERFG